MKTKLACYQSIQVAYSFNKAPKLTEFETNFIVKIYECALNLYENKVRT